MSTQMYIDNINETPKNTEFDENNEIEFNDERYNPFDSLRISENKQEINSKEMNQGLKVARNIS